MYRQLHPDGPKTRNKQVSKSGLDTVSQGSLTADYREVPAFDRSSAVVQQGYATSFTRRDSQPPELVQHQRLGSTMQTQSTQRISANQKRTTTSLLQNTPQAVDLHRSNFLSRGRTLSHMMNHAQQKMMTNQPSPQRHLKMMKSGISQTTISAVGELSQINLQNRLLGKFSPLQTSNKKFESNNAESRAQMTT